MLRGLLVFCLLVTYFGVGLASQTAVSRYGNPQLPPNFTHFPFVNPKAPKGGILRLGTVGTFDNLNVFIIKGANSAASGMAITHDRLMKRVPGEPFSLYPLIAEKVDIAPDASEITIYLNPKAVFHDGTPITAEDIKFTIELLTEKGLPRYRQFFSKIRDVTIINPTTLKITFNKGEQGYDLEAPYLVLLLVCPLSKKSLEGKDFTATGLTPLLGSGPYKIKELDQGRHVIYERVKDYWAEDLPSNVGQFNFDLIRVDYYKNAASYFQSFLAGEFDCFFETDPNHWHTGYESSKAVKSGQIQLHKVALERPVTVRTIIFNMRRPHFSDIRVRKALDYAFDFETLNKMIFWDELKRPASLFANTILAHQGMAQGKERELLQKYGIDPDLEPYTPPKTDGSGNQRENLSMADKLLTEAGWIVIDGKRVQDMGNKKYSEPLQFEFLIKDPKLEKVGLNLKNSLAKLGIHLNVRLVDSVQYETRTANRDFDMIVHSWSNTLAPGYEQAYFFSAKNADIDGSSNYIGVKDSTIEALAGELTFCKDYDTLTASVHAFDRAVMNQHYFIPFTYDPNIYFALWADRIDFPPIDLKTGMNIMDYGWAKDTQTTPENPKPSSSSKYTFLILLIMGLLFIGVRKARRSKSK